MGVVMGITAAVLGIAAGLVGMMVWTALLFPGPVTRAGQALQTRPGRCFLLGLLLTVLIGFPMLRLIGAPHGLAKMGGWALALPLAAVLVVGLTAMAQVLGQRLQALSPTLTPLGGIVRGAVTIELAILPPFVGWFLFAPLVGVTLVGAGTMGCVGRRKDSTQRHGDTEGDGEAARWKEEPSQSWSDGKSAEPVDPLVPSSLSIPVGPSVSPCLRVGTSGGRQ